MKESRWYHAKDNNKTELEKDAQNEFTFCGKGPLVDKPNSDCAYRLLARPPYFLSSSSWYSTHQTATRSHEKTDVKKSSVVV